MTVVECPGCRNTMSVLRQFGPFELECFLAQGGVGVVYQAVDRVLQRPVAVKVLQPVWSENAEVVFQFKREAAMAALVTHPGVVRVYTTGEAFGMFYIAMELAEEGALDARMEARGRLPEAEVLEIFRQVTDGLAAAHRAGLIHRDIKPGNILFARDGRVKIVDFGLALQGRLPAGTVPGGELWGTPFYIAPEILSGVGADFRSDMYALGSSMWHALVGEPPYPSQETSIPELLEMKRHPVDVRKVLRGIHPRTAALLNRTVAFDAEDRYGSYEALLEDIDAALERKGQGGRKGWFFGV